MKTLTRGKARENPHIINLEPLVLLENISLYNKKGIFFIILNDGIIQSISERKPTSFQGKSYNLLGKTAIPGAIDIHTLIREPGREDLETLETASLAATNGGFTQICMMPSTTPPLDSAEMLQFVKEKSHSFLTQINVIGALTKGRKGRSIAPFAELAEEGAVAFSDGSSNIQSTKLMHIALEYAKMLQLPIIVKPCEKELSEGGQMHEGFQSTRLGLTGIPSIAEDIIVSRDLQIAEYVSGKIHFTNISSKHSVELIRQAKKRGVRVTCDVSIHSLLHTDEALASFDTNLKFNPPLRSEEHFDALIEGLKDQTIDAISSSHTPQSWEDKEAEFIYAPCGAVSLETMIPLLLDRFFYKSLFTLEELSMYISLNPSKIFNLPNPKIQKGKQATLTILDLKETTIVNKKKFLSKSQNTPYDGQILQGSVFGVLAKKNLYLKSGR